MSIVIGIAHKNTVLIESDGRATSTKTGNIISERQNKTRKLSDTAICGFTGHYNACDLAVRNMIQSNGGNLRTMSLKEQAEALYYASIFLLSSGEPLEFAFVVGGFDVDGLPALYSWQNTEKISVHKPSPLADIAFVSLDPPDYPCNMTQMLGKYLKRDSRDYCKAVDSCIREVARGCPAVNASIFREILVRRDGLHLR